MLLFLARGNGYGYGIAEQLDEQALAVDKTIMYRTLRGFESAGYVTSRWIHSSQGPRRRLYSLTSAGRRTLDAMAADIARNRMAYQAFLEAYEQRSARPAQRSGRRGALPGDAARRPERDLLVGWLLLLLETGVTYGYDLRRHLAAHHVVADPARVYRALRQLEADGRLQSHWSQPIDGPKRRLYRASVEGRAELHEIAASIAQTRDLHAAFIGAYDELDHGCPRPARSHQ
jgi:DNA-binding PadR family transcriptional regulator